MKYPKKSLKSAPKKEGFKIYCADQQNVLTWTSWEASKYYKFDDLDKIIKNLDKNGNLCLQVFQEFQDFLCAI